MKKNYQFIVGIDVSKTTLDVCIMQATDPSRFLYCQVTNNIKGYLRLLTWIKHHKMVLNEGLFVLEHTGIYSLIVCIFFKKRNLNYTLIPGLVLRKSLGICRGKDDKKDAYSIAKYGYLYREEIKINIINEEILLNLQMLYGQRRRMVTAIKALLVPIKEMREMGLDEMANSLEQNQKSTIDSIKIEIKEIESQMLNLIDNDQHLRSKYQLCTSVAGVGMQLASYLLIVTHAFSRFDNSRKLATYAGIAPFPYQSGSSIKGKNKTNALADKALKSLLHMGALNAIRLDMQLKTYYELKKSQGKNAMLVLNAVRNKLLARIIATVNRGTPYVLLDKHVA